MPEKIGVLGAGSWGMAIADLLAQNDHDVTLWEFDRREYGKLVKYRGQPDKLKNFKLIPSIKITNDLVEALYDVSLVVLVVPSQCLRSVLKSIKSIPDITGLVHLSKGVETGTLQRMSEIIENELKPNPALVAVLSGPSHAEEVVLKMPTAVVAAGRSEDFTGHLQSIFSNGYFRVYKSSDIIGVELGGALKNIIAIGAGIADGLNMGDNTRGAILTRGLAEITRLGIAMGAHPETFAGLSGIGDLITTCTSNHSRNRHVGLCIGQGEKLNDILNRMTMVAEGVQTTRSGYELGLRYNVEMPITVEVYRVLFENKPASEAVADLMERKLKSEVWQ